MYEKNHKYDLIICKWFYNDINIFSENDAYRKMFF
jgi:hypothetical protein